MHIFFRAMFEQLVRCVDRTMTCVCVDGKVVKMQELCYLHHQPQTGIVHLDPRSMSLQIKEFGPCSGIKTAKEGKESENGMREIMDK